MMLAAARSRREPEVVKDDLSEPGIAELIVVNEWQWHSFPKGIMRKAAVVAVIGMLVLPFCAPANEPEKKVVHPGFCVEQEFDTVFPRGTKGRPVLSPFATAGFCLSPNCTWFIRFLDGQKMGGYAYPTDYQQEWLDRMIKGPERQYICVREPR
jgi:hypothetical protein